eukprot:1134363-Pyramimonas_sp.AAC.1
MAAAQAEEDRVKIDRAIAKKRDQHARRFSARYGRPPRQRLLLGRLRPPARQSLGGAPLQPRAVRGSIIGLRAPPPQVQH